MKCRQNGKRLPYERMMDENAENATLGTCYDTGENRIFHCSECGLGIDDVYVDDETLYPPADFPRFCPWCGRKVVSK